MKKLIPNSTMAVIDLLLLWFILFVVAGCYTRKKAEVQHGRAVNTYRDIGADWCAKEYPVTAKTDSTGFKKSLAVIDSLSKALKEDSLLSQEERDRLMIEIERIRLTIPKPEDCDSVSDAIYRLAAKEKQRGDKLEAAYNNLLAATKQIKPVIDTVVDKASLDLCNIQMRAAVMSLGTEQALHAKYKAQAKKRGSIMWGLIIGLALAAGVWTYFKFRSSALPKTKLTK